LFVTVDVASGQTSVPSKRLQGHPRTNLFIRTRCKPFLESNDAIRTTASELMASSDCSLDISCSTVAQPEPDRVNSTTFGGLTTVSKAADDANETLSDSSTASAENSASSTVSAPSSSELEQQHLHGLPVDRPHRRGQMKKNASVLKNFDGTECEIASNDAACLAAAVSSTDTPNKDQIIVAASNRVQNYLASLGLPGVITVLLPLLLLLDELILMCRNVKITARTPSKYRMKYKAFMWLDFLIDFKVVKVH